jgi:hypothetical protein
VKLLLLVLLLVLPPAPRYAVDEASVSWVAQWQSTGGRIGRPEVAGSNPALGTAGAPLKGWATYFDAKAGTAAAGPLLRSGDWRGRVVTVCAGECVTVRLTDWCACGSRHGKPTLIDLARADFARLAPTSQGVVWVMIGRATLPATDTVETP